MCHVTDVRNQNVRLKLSTLHRSHRVCIHVCVCVPATESPIYIIIGVCSGVLLLLIVCSCCYCRVLHKSRVDSPNNPRGSAAQVHGHTAQRMNKPEAAEVIGIETQIYGDIPNDHATSSVPTTIGMCTMEIPDAEMILPPAMIGEMEAIPVAVAQATLASGEVEAAPVEAGNKNLRKCHIQKNHQYSCT